MDTAAQPLAFFRDLHDAFSRTWDAAGHPEQQLPAVLLQAWDCFEGNVQLQSDGEPPIDCGKGCAACCTLRVTATAPEVFMISKFIEGTAHRYAQAGLDLCAALQAADARTRGLDEPQRVALRQRCPFMANGACTIYPVRPLACRGHASHDRRACADAAAGRVEAVPFSQPHRWVRSLVQSALQSMWRARGLAHGVYELNHALMIALQARAGWLGWCGGADPLAPAAVETAAELAEMGHIFDQALGVARAG